MGVIEDIGDSERLLLLRANNGTAAILSKEYEILTRKKESNLNNTTSNFICENKLLISGSQ